MDASFVSMKGNSMRLICSTKAKLYSTVCHAEERRSICIELVFCNLVLSALYSLPVSHSQV